MNLKNKFSLLLFLGIFLFSLSSCSDDDPEKLPTYTQLSDVSLKQTINGKESLELTTSDEELIFSSELGFDEKTINWSKPTLEQSFNAIFELSKENITVTDSKGTAVSSTDITVDGSKVQVSFVKVDNSYNYMTSSTYIINIKTKIKDGVTEEELLDLSDNGFSSQSIFYGESSDQNIKSNTIEITSKINPDANYDVKGDPNNDSYPYKLNVIYFVASDIKENPGFKRRISTILLKHQLFVSKWMNHWGYGERSFGLPLDENGMVEIITVHGEGKKADYPYASNPSVGKITNEIKNHYEKNGLTFYSDHTLVITATNGDISETPFYGSGRWCFALDYPGMSYDLYNIDPLTNQPMNPEPLTTSLIGGLLHELGHGLNSPHVGPTYTQKNDSQFGTPLMGSGNMSYGKTPTFMHPATAAFMNNCQISSKVEKTFYNDITASVKISGITINGGQCTVKGTFNASEKVNNVLLNFFDSRQSHLQSDGGYNSVAFVAKPNGNSFEFTIPIAELRINTFDYKLGVTILMENGMRKATAAPYVYHLVKNGSEYTLESEDIVNDGTWEVTTSHALPKDDAISNAPGSLVDGDLTTCLSMVKPGRSYAGVSVPETDIVFATINFKKQIEFNIITLNNRNFQEYLNAKAVSFYGSNDGTSFTPIKTDIDLPDPKVNEITLDAAVKYQYLKMTFDKWDDSSGSTMQFSELGLKNKK